MSGSPDDVESFESLYTRAGDDVTILPWARLAPHRDLLSWLDGRWPAGHRLDGHRLDGHRLDGHSALVIGCGLGDDAEELARRGLDVTAFDFASAAIARCRGRFPSSSVQYRVADLFELPREWQRRFDVVVEIHTVQSVPPGQQRDAMIAIANTVAPGGRLFVRCRVRALDEPPTGRPWALRRHDLGAAYTDAGLQIDEFDDVPAGEQTWPHVVAVYSRPAG